MKVKIFACVTLGLTLTAVLVNTIIMRKQISSIKEAVDELEITKENTKYASGVAEGIYKDFKKKAKYISLTVNHDDLTNIEEGFAELIGYLTVDDADGANVTKNRLLDSLEHLGRLSGMNIDAII